MCLYPKFIINRKYIPNKKNKGNPPALKDERAKYVPIGCGKCMECKKQKSRGWQVRLHEEIRNNKCGKFVTLSFSEESLVHLEKDLNTIRIKIINILNKQENKRYSKKYKPLEGYHLDNELATLATRRFLERWRKEFKTSCKHWLVTELGQLNTERIHIHGLIFTNETKQTISDIWKYGNVWIGDYVNEQTINYIVKYIYKTDEKHKYYNPVILTSPKLGYNYINRNDSKLNKYNNKKTNELYVTRTGIKLPLPIYYRNKIYTDEEKENLWLNLLDKNTRYINKIKINVAKGEDEYFKVLEEQRRINTLLGYGDNKIDWNKKHYEQEIRNVKKLERIAKQNNK